jgi:Methyltransferase domain
MPSESALEPGRLVEPALRERLEQLLEEIPIDEGGGASALKVLVLADLILGGGVVRVLEIGVYRGRLLLPLAEVMAWREGGVVFGIDPYSHDAAVQLDAHERPVDLTRWSDGVDWEALFESVRGQIERRGLQSRCHLIRARSQDVPTQLPQALPPEGFEMLHIDGNHDRVAVSRDANLYIPTMRPGGLVVLDDASWPSIAPVLDNLRRDHELVFALLDPAGIAAVEGGGNDFAVFRLRGHGEKVTWQPLP